jgi:DNA-directed RNA polymerase subunit H
MQTTIENCVEMLRNRGHSSIRCRGELITSISPKGFDHLTLLRLSEKLTAADIKDVVRASIENNFPLCMIVYDKFTSVGSTIHWCKNLVEIELFHVDSLVFRILDHQLVPVHQALDEKEQEEFRAKFPKLDLPRIRTDDPIARYFGWKPSQIVRVTQKDSGEISYSVVSRTSG